MQNNNQPEWISSTLVTGIHVTDEGPKRAQIKVGIVRLPGSGGVRVASQAQGRDLFILSPQATARIIGALRRGLLDL